MDNQHKHIKGYRDLSQEEIDLMNEIKQKGQELEALCKKVAQHNGNQYEAAGRADTSAEIERLEAANPMFWHDWAKGSFQSGLMYLTRAVAQPTTF